MPHSAHPVSLVFSLPTLYELGGSGLFEPSIGLRKPGMHFPHTFVDSTS